MARQDDVQVRSSVDLRIDGMTCASCAARIEKRLNQLDGVSASVNFATEEAHVEYPVDLQSDDLVAEVAAAGYGAALIGAAPASAEDDSESDSTRALRNRVVISAVLTAPVLAMAMVPAMQFDGWQWVSLVLATPVVVWGAFPFHKAAWTNLRHGTATMDTLISIGVLAAFGWSLYALFIAGAGEPDMRMSFDWTLSRDEGAHAIYSRWRPP
jgi:Cu+-exporting ATPase